MSAFVFLVQLCMIHSIKIILLSHYVLKASFLLVGWFSQTEAFDSEWVGLVPAQYYHTGVKKINDSNVSACHFETHAQTLTQF